MRSDTSVNNSRGRMTRRPKINQSIVAELQFRADLRCCLCQNAADLPPRPANGQIHHVDGNPCNNAIENLVWLCLDHHEEVGKSGPSSRRIYPKAVKRYRDDLEHRVRRQREAPRTHPLPARPWFAAALDAGIVLDVYLNRAQGTTDWDEVANEVNRLGSYPEAMGYEARQSILRRLDTIARGTRFKMPESVASTIRGVVVDLLPLLFLHQGRHPRPTREMVDNLIIAASIGESLAYDGALKLGNLRIAEEGCDILWRVMSIAAVHKQRRLREAANRAFATAHDGALRSGVSGAVDLVTITQRHGEVAATRLPEYPDSIARLL